MPSSSPTPYPMLTPRRERKREKEREREREITHKPHLISLAVVDRVCDE